MDMEAKAKVTVEDADASGKAKSLYMFMFYAEGSIVNSLYCIDLTNPLLLPPKKKNPSKAIGRPIPLSPILELRRKEYPWGMRCVELDSKLYFVGGQVERKNRNGWDISSSPSTDVYVFDTIASIGTVDKYKYLKKGTPMTCGKRQPLVFAADRKIYLISGLTVYSDKNEKLSRFEVFDPDSDEWTVLDEPPMTGSLSAYVVVRRKVFVVDLKNGLYSFNLDINQWEKILLATYSLFSRFCGRAEFVDDTVYGCPSMMSIGALGPLSSSLEAEEEMLKRPAYLSLDTDAITRHLPVLNPASFLTHLGGRRFCYMLTGSPQDAKYKDLPNPKRRNFSITIFDALTDTYTDGGKTYVRAKFMHSAHFVTSCSSGFVHEGYIEDCFSLPS